MSLLRAWDSALFDTSSSLSVDWKLDRSRFPVENRDSSPLTQRPTWAVLSQLQPNQPAGDSAVFSLSASIQSVANGVLDRPAPYLQERIRVFIAESTRMGSQLIEGAFQKHRQKFDVHAFSGGSCDTLRELERKQPHVAIVSADLEDGPLTGFKVLHQLRHRNVRTCTVMLLNSSERDLVIDAFRSGARGVFTRAHSVDALPKCIRVVHGGQVWVNNDQIELLLELVMRLTPLQVVRPGAKASLTHREEEVVQLVAEGMRNEEISKQLKITEHTVRNYLCRIFEKIGLSSRVELVLYALSR